MHKNSLFVLKETERDLRGHSLKIQKQHARLNIRKNSYSHRVVDHWNMLPKSAVEAASVNTFKGAVDAFFSTKYDKYDF